MKPGERLMSLDTLRGFDMIFILGLATLIVNICRLFPGGADCWLAVQMTHVDWEGFRHHDTIFPLFLFMAGVSWPFSHAKQIAKGASKARIFGKIFYRGLMLFFIGVVYNGLLRFDFPNLRWMGVLQHIGLAWMFAALIYVTLKQTPRAIVAAALLIGYWLLLKFVPAPDMPAGTDPYSFDGCLPGYIDRVCLPGRLYNGTFDPEGLLSIIPAIVTAMLGMFTGDFIRLDNGKYSGNQKTLIMLGAAALMLAVGLVWSIDFPIIKKIWTSTFVLVAGAYSVASMAIFYWIIDVKGWKKWTLPLRVIGMNSITIYLAKRVIDFGYTNKFFLAGIADLCSPAWGAVIMSAGMVFLSWLFCHFLYKKGIFFRI
ncbi:MAG: DUF5009 domain-containing protein [Bacteroidales bacterium]|nr:DUF5009 domain-containing protein [Bacteroidales bacterium]